MAEQRESERAETVGSPFEHVATKEDVANVRTEIAESRTDLKTDVANVRTEVEGVRTEVAELRGDTNTQNADLRTYIEQVRADLIERIAAVDKNVESIRAEMRTMKWMMGIVVAAVLVQLLERFFS